MRFKPLVILLTIVAITGCATTQKPNYDILRRAEKGAAKISDYSAAIAPAADDVVIGVDISDTTMAPTGTTKRFRLQDLPIATSVQAALDGKQEDLPLPADADLQAGIASDEIVLTAAKLVVAIQAHAMAKDRIRIPQTTAEPTDEEIGDIYRADGDLWNPLNRVGPYDVITVATGSPGTYTGLRDLAGNLLIQELATKAVFVQGGIGVNLTSDDCGKIVKMTGAGEVGLPDCDADLDGCFFRVDQDRIGGVVELAMFGDLNDYFVLEDGSIQTAGNEVDHASGPRNRVGVMCNDVNEWGIEEIKGPVTPGGLPD